MKEIFLKEMKALDFSPRFIQAVEQNPYRNRDDQRLPGTYVNAKFLPSPDRTPSGQIIRTGQILSFSHTWRYYDRLDKKYKKTFRKYRGTEHIYAGKNFDIYRQERAGETNFILVVGKQIYSRFDYDDKSPLINTGQIGGKEMLFLGFPSKKETIIIAPVNNLPCFVWGVPFLISSASADSVTMSCGVEVRTSVERFDDDAPYLVFHL